MALSKTRVTPHGFEAAAAYHRVEQVLVEDKTTLRFRVRAYKELGKPAFFDAEYTCGYELTGLNPITQAYEHLKTLSEFDGAVDC